MQTQALPRKFKLMFRNSQRLLNDPNPDLALDEVKAHLSAMYPELASAAVIGPEIADDAQVYTLSAKTVGVKG